MFILLEEKKMIGHLETRYYKNEKPNLNKLDHTKKEENPVWLNVIIEKKIFNFICDKGVN